MAMEVAENGDACRLLSSGFHVDLEEVKLRVYGSIGIAPSPVEVNSS